ncbi:MFS transporter [Candidatus Trichorickettsia mobilis]|uniref:MFS transporter n=1 Tax=Candidatus Trichorickettsia mobilis TaxID=1346319 RepID=A0ABZ0UUJ9_9RICK|nr:MFS transporter [Candidatus Trichorickettsia mobilis]WPY00307.1 MFS transporter [Candidatus Trichorickettsia mobilis]
MKISALIIAFLATLIQCYDYALFGLSAAQLAKNFMPHHHETEQLLHFFTIFSIAVIARPLGSIIFGMIGDNYGRVNSVKIAAGIAAISTGCIGLMPGFEIIGWCATILLTICRMTFLMSLAGEIDATRIYVAEKIGVKHRNLANGIVSFYSQIGALLAATSYHMTANAEITDLWRINFIIGGVAGALIILMRRYFQESDEFLNFKAKTQDHRGLDSEIITLIKAHKLQFFLSILINGCNGGIYHFLIIFFATFASKIAYIINSTQAQFANICFIATYAIASVLSGFIADKFSAKKQIITALTVSIIIITIIIILSGFGITDSTLYIIMLLVGLLPFYVVPLQIIIQSMFSIGIKMRMCSLSHSIGSMLLSSTTPFFCMLLWKYTGSITIIFSFLLTLIAILLGAVTFCYSTALIAANKSP